MKGYLTVSVFQNKKDNFLDMLRSIEARLNDELALQQKSVMASGVESVIECQGSLCVDGDYPITLSFSERPKVEYRDDRHSALHISMKMDYPDLDARDAGLNAIKQLANIVHQINPSKVVSHIDYKEYAPAAEVLCYTDNVNMGPDYVNLQKAMDKNLVYLSEMGSGDFVVIDELHSPKDDNKVGIMAVNSFGEIVGRREVDRRMLIPMDEGSANLMNDFAFKQGVEMARNALSLWSVSQIKASWVQSYYDAEDDLIDEFVVDVDVENVVFGEASNERIANARSDLESLINDKDAIGIDFENIADTLRDLDLTSKTMIRTQGLVPLDGLFIEEIERFNQTQSFWMCVRRGIEAQEGLKDGMNV